MTAFPRTRTAARYALRHTSSDLTRDGAARLMKQLNTCEAALAGNGQLPGLLRSLVLATRGLAGPAWLTSNADEPAVEAFATLQATPGPPSPSDLDDTLARVLWARFAPAGAAATPGSQQYPAASWPADLPVPRSTPSGCGSQRRGGGHRRGNGAKRCWLAWE